MKLNFPETNGGWKKYEGNPVLGNAELGTCFDVKVLKDEKGYTMHFSWRPKKALAKCVSPDGIHWSAPQIYMEHDPACGWMDNLNRNCVLKRGDQWHMWFTGQARLPLTQARTVDTGRRSTGARLSVLGLEWPITRATEYPSQRVELEYLPIGGLFVPLEIERATHVETRQAQAEIPEQTLRERARALALADARTALRREGPARYIPGESWVDYEISDGALIAKAVIEIQSDAAVTRETLQGG